MTLAPGLTARMLFTVDAEDTAQKVGSGDVPVLATPRLLAFAEAVTVQAIREHLEPGQTTVGVHVELDHLAASPVGTHVEVTAELTKVDGRRLVFGFTARDRDRLVSTGVVERVVVDRERFLANRR
ncbi:thioesterase family protein [Thermostaphylospora chromogena]|uniref:Predicted thioesterase n=1 Tax=Thermostaphylospora chromogena TaxID=35622 RepID=A0A1H1APJ5_9ACTN|nr:hotdog domain-containing protein [Thermostaphylospora chromogena]SDQ41431.1 Predicted thioesterase [Thermostaphylospora chromogena]